MKKSIKWIILAVALICELFGIISLLYISNIVNWGFLGFYSSMRLIVRYVIAIVFMTAGILSFTVFSGMFQGKTKNTLSISCTVYSTILTLPLLYVFVGCFFAAGGATLPLVNEIVVEFQDIFTNPSVCYLMFSLGTLMALIFVAVPILTTIMTVKNIKPADLFKRKKSS